MRPIFVMLLAACVLTGLWAVKPTPAAITPAQAADYEGQEVRVKGIVADVRAWSDGSARLRIAMDGHGVDVDVERWDGTLGMLAEAQGRLIRINGELRLLADQLDLSIAAPTTVSLGLLAAQPDAWQHTSITVQGTWNAGTLTDGYHTIRTGDGAWVTGPVRATGMLAYGSRCACYQFHATALQPWNSS